MALQNCVSRFLRKLALNNSGCARGIESAGHYVIIVDIRWEVPQFDTSLVPELHFIPS